MLLAAGGREHAIIRALKKSPDCTEIWCAPGNGGISYDATCKAIPATDVEAMVAFAKQEAFDYVVVAQDDPLALGMVDALAAAGIPAFGPDKAAARIEASKVFSKNLMKQYGIPTADYEVFEDPAKVMDYVRARGKYPVVIKADGLALGKGRADLPGRGRGRRRRPGDHAGQKVRCFRQPRGGRGVFDRPGGQRAELLRRQDAETDGLQHGP